MPIKQIEVFECKVCGHQWQPRVAGKKPKTCPKCGSVHWETGRRRPPIEEQRKAAAERKIAEASKLLKQGAPLITNEMRRDALKNLGEFFTPSGQQYRIGTVNAGPWRDITNAEPEYMTDFELLGWQEGDMLWRVSEDKENGQCLTGDNIHPGDVLHFRPGLEPSNDDIVLAIGHDVHGNFFATTKHFYKNGIRWDGRPVIELRPSNPKCKTVSAFPDHLEIHGVLINALRIGFRRRNKRIGK